MPDKSQISEILTEQFKQQMAALTPREDKRPHPFRSAILRGLGVFLPPLLTIVIFFWIGGTIATYVINPVHSGTRSFLIWLSADIVLEQELPEHLRGQEKPLFKKGLYRKVADSTYIPEYVWEKVLKSSSAKYPMPKTGIEIYQRYVDLTILHPVIFLPFLVLLLTLLLYLIGKFIAAEIGRFFWLRFEKIVQHLPLVSNVYGAVKQVSDFVFAEQSIPYSRVVAIEWPRKGIWALALVTSEGFPALEKLIGEPVYGVLVPTSPMPLTGFTLTVKQSEAHDIGISLDQAIQFIVSCGVVTTPQLEDEMPNE